MTYYHIRQGVLATGELGIVLDQKPVTVFGYVPGLNYAYWWGAYSNSPGSGPPPHIVIGEDAPGGETTSNSAGNTANRPDNREWHEFGHYAVADALSNLQPRDPAPCTPPGSMNCAPSGYQNMSTTDSWVEGMAEFYSMLVDQTMVKGGTKAWLYHWLMGETNLESNFMAWASTNGQSFEEFAVAALLWDLQDPVEERDATVLARDISDPGAPTARYADHVQVDLKTLWTDLTARYKPGA